MTRDEILALVADILGGIAPEADIATVPGDADLRDALDLDSMDILNFVAALHERTRRPIPEADTPRLVTLNGVVAYFQTAGP
ncbi:acyl carrier protein [Falsiroseomonas tokyonensis]|uniref:Acyl carrier protein n=1 Tax=Falsiroseomonas tokyonensis TaxID=430521 RepID=A0ABV7C469_9PROT|nr:acyl carrier protein [Falsiroseomonas tokyonensis]MBU8541424.1 acyl carrier protein [Falsiroseomonas tokyonensis]